MYITRKYLVNVVLKIVYNCYSINIYSFCYSSILLKIITSYEIKKINETTSTTVYTLASIHKMFVVVDSCAFFI